VGLPRWRTAERWGEEAWFFFFFRAAFDLAEEGRFGGVERHSWVAFLDVVVDTHGKKRNVQGLWCGTWVVRDTQGELTTTAYGMVLIKQRDMTRVAYYKGLLGERPGVVAETRAVSHVP
jgi:hypothetical protein